MEETDRDKLRQTETEAKREIQKLRQRDGKRERQRQKWRETQTETQRETERETNRDTDRAKDREMQVGRQAGRQRCTHVRLSVCLSVRPSVRLSLYACSAYLDRNAILSRRVLFNFLFTSVPSYALVYLFAGDLIINSLGEIAEASRVEQQLRAVRLRIAASRCKHLLQLRQTSEAKHVNM